MMSRHDRLWAATKKLDGDYTPYGKLERWANANDSYADCSSGCGYYIALHNRGAEDMDWGVCTNPKSHRCGLLTFEHQGCQQFARHRSISHRTIRKEPGNG